MEDVGYYKLIVEPTFPYTGIELLPFAAKKKQEYLQQKIEAQTELANLLESPKQAGDELRIEELREAIQDALESAEICAVYEEGCRREPERTFDLDIADVLFFGLVTLGD